MGIVVQKFGGTSVANAERIKRVAQRVARTKDAGNKVVVVVSALGETTDELIELAHQVSEEPSGREFDMLLSTGEQVSIALLAMALQDRGYDAISFTGMQVGIITDSFHTKARIVSVDTNRIMRELSRGNAVIVAGFQGVSADREITTLGRGGSDTTAVALATVLAADVCEIYTDVEGVFTADPRIVPNARKLPIISYDEMLELAGAGAKVLHLRSVELAKKYGVKLHVRSSFTEEEGTLVVAETEEMERQVISGVSLDKGEAKLSVADVPDVPGIAAKLFGSLADRGINVDMIVQSVGENSLNTISFTVPQSELKAAVQTAETVARELGAKRVLCDPGIAKVSAVGVGMRSHSGVAARMFKALGDAGINIHMISTSEIRISCVVDEERSEEALKVVHEAFELSKLTVEQGTRKQ
jgi:aspartate kinase